MPFDPDACADLVLNAYHNVGNWWDAHEPEDVKPMRDDIRTGLAAVLRSIAESSSPAAAFELRMLADEMEPTDV
jgi:hydrogenase maturation factor